MCPVGSGGCPGTDVGPPATSLPELHFESFLNDSFFSPSAFHCLHSTDLKQRVEGCSKCMAQCEELRVGGRWAFALASELLFTAGSPAAGRRHKARLAGKHLGYVLNQLLRSCLLHKRFRCVSTLWLAGKVSGHRWTGGSLGGRRGVRCLDVTRGCFVWLFF